MEEKRSTLKAIVLNKSMIPYVAISIFAIVFFISIYGVKVLDFQNVDWLYGHYEVKEGSFGGKDLTQQYMGWLCYRQSDWTFPIGDMNLFSYPYQTSVIYTDSIPLFALFFKILSPILPEQFQYFGLWAILCFILQGIMAVRLFKSYTDNPVKLVLSAVFFVVAPTLTWRTFNHSALCAHWIILLAMEPLVCKERWGRKKIIIHYSIIGFLAPMITVYFLLFCGIVLLGTCIRDILESKKIGNSILFIISYLGAAALTIWMMGGFSSEFTSSNVGLGIYSMNLNALFDSYDYSTFFKGLPRYITEDGDKQYEGYAYLGAGFIIILTVSVVCFIVKLIRCKNIILNKKSILIGSSVVICIALAFSVSPYITLNNAKILELHLPSVILALWSIFRATGRGVWIIEYFIMCFACLFVIQTKRKCIMESLLVFCLIIQLIDNRPLYITISDYFKNDVKAYYKYESLVSCPDFWEGIATNKTLNNIIMATTTTPYDEENIITINNVKDSIVGLNNGYFLLYQYLLGDFSIKNGKTFNYYRFSRHPYERNRKYVLEKLNNPTEEDLFVFFEYNKFQGVAAGLNMYEAEGLYWGCVGSLDEKYRLSMEEIRHTYIFSDSEELVCVNDVYNLASGAELKCYSLEMPRGIYMISIYGNHMNNVDYNLSVASNETASVMYRECGDDVATYFVLVEEDTYRAYNYLKNEGNEMADLYALEISYLGTEDMLYDTY